jgi:transposase
VSTRFVWGLVKHVRHTGSYAPKPHGGGNPPRIPASQYEIVSALVKHYPDAPLNELCARFAATCPITPRQSRLHRILDNWRLTRQKRPLVRQNRTLQPSRPNEKLIKQKCGQLIPMSMGFWMRLVSILDTFKICYKA